MEPDQVLQLSDLKTGDLHLSWRIMEMIAEQLTSGAIDQDMLTNTRGAVVEQSCIKRREA